MLAQRGLLKSVLAQDSSGASTPSIRADVEGVNLRDVRRCFVASRPKRTKAQHLFLEMGDGDLGESGCGNRLRPALRALFNAQGREVWVRDHSLICRSPCSNVNLGNGGRI